MIAAGGAVGIRDRWAAGAGHGAVGGKGRPKTPTAGPETQMPSSVSLQVRLKQDTYVGLRFGLATLLCSCCLRFGADPRRIALVMLLLLLLLWSLLASIRRTALGFDDASFCGTCLALSAH